MASYSMTCSCGETMSVDAPSREDAVKMLQGGMTQDAINSHMADKHKGEAVPTVQQVHGMIAELTK
jgi:hypothetical protein